MSTEVKTAAAGSRPAMLGMKLFVVSDLATFAALLAVAIVLGGDERLVSSGQGAILTGILAAVSLTLILGSRAERGGSRRIATASAGLLAAAFLLVAALEARALIAAGHDVRDSQEVALFFTLTGFHAAHVAAGVLLLGLATARPALLRPVALYWHMVDALWLALFVRFYL